MESFTTFIRKNLQKIQKLLMNASISRFNENRLRFQTDMLASKKTLILIAGLVIILGGTGIWLSFGSESPSLNPLPGKGVLVATLGTLSNESAPLPLTGTVRSESEAELRTENSGEVIGVYRTVGSSVAAGSIIAEMENSRERAVVLQAEGQLQAARAGLQKVQKGTRDEQLAILSLNVQNAERAVLEAESGARTTLGSAYAAVSDAVLRQTDVMFADPLTINPRFLLSTSDSQLIFTVQNQRISIGDIIKRQEAHVPPSENTDLDLELTKTENELRVVERYLSSIIGALNRAIPSIAISESEIATYLTSANTARSAISASLSAISASRDSLNGKRTALSVAKENQTQGITGAESTDVAVAQAAVTSAEGLYASALANLEKTRIRSPISGTLSSLAVERGDFLSAFTLVGVVSNNRALQIETFISGDDRRFLSVGAKATISGEYEGVITSIAPGIDPETRKIKVKIGLTNPSVPLTHGDTVRVSIERSVPSTPTTIGSTKDSFIIPLTAVKILPESTVLYSVSSEQTLVAHPVEIIAVLGDKVLVKALLDPMLQIVTDARGLRENDRVQVTPAF